MATVIDSLVVELGLDPSKFREGQREAVNSANATVEAMLAGGKAIESQSKKTYDLFSDFRRQALSVLGLFLGGRGVAEFVSYITTLDASTGRFAKTVDMTASAVSSWQGAFEQIGGTAEGANAALGGLSGEMHRFQLTGQSAMLPVLSRLGVSLYDQNRHLKTAGALWLDLADAVKGMDSADATAFLNMVPGANQDMINFALMGRDAMQQYLDAARKARDLTDQDVESAKEYQRELGILERSATSFGQAIVTALGPAASAGMRGATRLIQAMTSGKKEDGSPAATGNVESLPGVGPWEDAAYWLNDQTGGRLASFFGTSPEQLEQQRAAMLARRAANEATRGGGGDRSPAAVEAYVRASASARGIDPDQAVRVFRAESGLNPGASGDNDTSFGVTQLHYGGGLGDVFTKQTGKDARDPSTWKAAVDFSLDQAKAGGWGPWHAWKGAPFAGIGGGGGPRAGAGGGTTVNVGGVTVNDSSGNADHIANTIAGGLRRSITAGSANAGPQ